MEEHVEGLDNVQKTIIHMVSEMSEDLRVALGIVRAKVASLSARLNLTIKVEGNQSPNRCVVQFNKIDQRAQALLWALRCQGSTEFYFQPQTIFSSHKYRGRRSEGYIGNNASS